MNRAEFSPRMKIVAGLLAISVASGCVEVKPAPTYAIESPKPTTIFEPIPSHLSPQPSLSPDSTIIIPSPAITPETTASPEIEVAERPNIVMIMLDDINPIDGRLWTKERMPAVYSTFVEKGVEFSQFYGETPLCCPGRVNSLTGQHTQNHGVLDNKKGYPQRFNPDTTIATELQDAGYITMIIGKYLNAFNKLDDQTPPGWTYQAIPDLNNAGRNYGYNLITKNGKEYRGYGNDDYSTDVFREKVIGYIKDAPRNKPIFAYINPTAMHGPYEAAPRHLNSPKCENIEPWKSPGYNHVDIDDPEYLKENKSNQDNENGYDLKKVCESMLAVDDLLRGVIDELREQGRLEDTMIIITSDNGMAWGDHGLTQKKNPYSTKIVLMVSWIKGIGEEGRIESSVISNIDLAPTLAEIAGVEMGPFPNGQIHADGISFDELLINEDAQPNEDNNREFILESQPTGGGLIPPWWAIRATEASSLGNYRYIWYETGEFQLYDLQNDPEQLDNIAYEPENKLLVEKLHKILSKLKKPFKRAT